MAKQNRFNFLQSSLEGEVLPEHEEDVTPSPSTPVAETVVPASEPKRGRATGKRSNPNYTQVGAYIPKELNRDVKRLLVDEEQDLSDLIIELLQTWVSSKSSKR